MIDLNDVNISYLITTPEILGISQMENNHRTNMFLNMLYSMNYSIIPIQSYDKGIYEKSYIAITPEDNERFKKEIFMIMEQFRTSEIIVKWKNDNLLHKMTLEGLEYPMEVNYYDNNLNNKIYIHEGISFSLNEKKRYFFPSKKEDLKSGMIVEYFNNNKWNQKQINDLDSEYEKMYKLLMKYEKLRINY
jgi:hypothetical protein